MIRVPAGDLVPNPRNWRRHPDAQRAALRGLLAEIGFADALLARRTDQGLELIDGHLRQEEMDASTEVPVLVLDLNDAEAEKLLLTLDPLAALAEPDSDALTGLLSRVETSSGAVRDLLEKVSRDAGLPQLERLLTQPDELPEAPEPRTSPGDLWNLGPHRLLCGDATSADDVERLLGGGIVDMVWTDPPYGVAYQTTLSTDQAVARHRRTDGLEVRNDDLTPVAHTRLLSAAFTEALDRQVAGGPWYVCAPHGPQGLRFAEVLAQLGVWRGSIVWIKDSFVMSRTDYHYRHEQVFYGWKPGARHRWYADRKQDTVWEIARPHQSKDHPTMKPVELIERSLRSSSREGHVVYDPFSGSGSTLIACDRMGRVSRGLEIDPSYCDVIVARWEQLTGQAAERA